MRDRVGSERVLRPVASPHPCGRDGDDGEVDRGVAQSRSRPGDRNGNDVIIANVVTELAEHDGDLDGLAVLIARVVVERVRERAEAEDAVAGLDVVQGRTRPTAGPLRQQPVAGALEWPVIRQVAPRDVCIEAFGPRHLDELVEHLQVVLAVGVDGEHEVVGAELVLREPLPQLGQRGVVRLRHAAVHLVDEEPAFRATAGHPFLDLGPRVVGRAVVDDDQLVDERIELFEHGRDRRLFVESRDHRDPTRRGRVHESACCSRYHSSVFRSPSAKVCSGTQPSSSRARSLWTMRAR